jgi:hypothetical protein
MRTWIAVVVAAGILGGMFAVVALRNSNVTPIEAPSSLDGSDSLVLLRCTSPQQDLNFANFWAGTRFDGLKVSGVIRRCDQPLDDEPVRANFVSYLYGDCAAADDEGCAPPIEIQTWPAEERNKDLYSSGPEEFQLEGTDVTVRGIPATRYENGRRLEIYYPDVTVVIFGHDPPRIDRFAAVIEEGPVVLTELGRFGITFDERCLRDPNYCAAGPAS